MHRFQIMFDRRSRRSARSEDEAHFLVQHRLAAVVPPLQRHGDGLRACESVSFVERPGVNGAFEVGGDVVLFAVAETPLE